MLPNSEKDFGELGGKLYEYLLDLQYSKIKDEHNWIKTLDI